MPEDAADSAYRVTQVCENVSTIVDEAETVEGVCHSSEVGTETGSSVEKACEDEDDLPLSSFKKSQKSPLKEIKLSDLCQPRHKKWYSNIYQTPEGSEDEHAVEPQTACCSTQLSGNKENQPVRCGDFLLFFLFPKLKRNGDKITTNFLLILLFSKTMCHEGGCGACVVSVSHTHPETKEKHVFAVNSCLVHVLSCHEWDITTVEGVGNRRDGYHPIQQRMASFNGTQCGYCTPGWVMNMFSLYESSNKTLTTQQIEKSFGGNICRCTGYRPILDALKSFATDADQRLRDRVQDMEDLDRIKCLKRCEKKCSETDEDWCVIEKENVALLHVEMKANRWYKAYTINDIFQEVYKDANLVVGAGMTLTDLMATCVRWTREADFQYLQQFHEHLDLVAHVPVRNIMPRAQNAHAILNAGFLFKLNSLNIDKCNIVFGNIRPEFVRASQTEQALKGMLLSTALVKGIEKLNEELMPVVALLSLSPVVNPRYLSGGTLLTRPVSRGTQTFDTDKSLWPLNEPVPKLEALTQCSGEARYSCDVSTAAREVHVAFVLSSKLKGVVSFLTAKDIPGKNSFTPTDVPAQDFDEEILASKHVSYYGQPIAVVAAVTHKLALKAAGMVRVEYKGKKEPVLSIEEALVAPDKDKRIREDVSIKPTNKGVDTTQVIKGNFSIPSQYHYTMETQCCTTANTELGLTVRSSTQVIVKVPRVGGAYGGKASRSALVACACALVARKLNRTATLVLPIDHNMAIVGKRLRCYADYEIGINKDGVIQYLTLSFYSDCGYSFNDSSAGEIASTITNLYESSRWLIKGYSVLTDKHSNTWCRAPGTTEGVAILEHIMHRIAHAVKRDPTDIKIQHLSPKHQSVKDLLLSFKTDIKYDERKAEIEKYNSQNAWKKQAIQISTMSYPIGYAFNFPVTISVYHADGTILISHGGIEMGQGINTKVAQVCAYTLKVALDKVTVQGSDTFVSPNSMASNGSYTSECLAFATVKACKELLDRMEPARSELNEPTWEEVVKRSFDKGINLQASYMYSDNDSLAGYNVYGACAAQVELDVLTGNHVVTRVDILEDTGIEGAFIMGLGLWTSEHLVYAPSGRLLTDRTWTYKPPGARDIPVDMRKLPSRWKIFFKQFRPNQNAIKYSRINNI
ncbi:hypothetical protein MSG28_004503 [Choristoneura fumiferana]|nr:hypothetical protein MSG28_004503 [Choristoneura fumiferana]